MEKVLHSSSGLAAATVEAVDIRVEQQHYQLHLSQLLQTSLDLKEILQLFFRELQQQMQVASLGYRNEQFCSVLNYGKSDKHSCHYALQINNANLGDLILTRSQRFSPEELSYIESLIGTLVCPIRNALLYQEALQAALKDSLTQVGNRVAFDTTIEREVSLALRHEHDLSLLVVDIDHFKKINDNYGHSTGDAVLTHIAKTLMDCCRECDACYRYGGEEVVVILNRTNSFGSKLIAERIRSRIATSSIAHDGNLIKVTASIGTATLLEKETPKALFDRADEALYSAKQNGRDQVIQAN